MITLIYILYILNEIWVYILYIININMLIILLVGTRYSILYATQHPVNRKTIHLFGEH